MSLRARLLLSVATTLFVPIAAEATAGQAVDIGQALPTFEAISLQGESLSLEAAVRDHKAVVVVFTSTVCPYARYFASHLRELAESYGPRGVLFVGINSNNWEAPAEVTEDAKEHGFTFPLLKDEHHVIADRLGATRTPEAFLVDSTGNLRYRGWVKSKQESPDLKRALDAVLAGRTVPRSVTKPFGCAIDRF